MNGKPLRVLRVDCSGRQSGSVSRLLADELIETLRECHGEIEVISRDLALEPLPFVDSAWIEAKNTDLDAHTAEQRSTLSVSDQMVGELKEADAVVIGVPVYNFMIPASLKAWIDMVARPRLTFRYTDQGPVGLLRGKKAFLVFTSGGTPLGSSADFASGYMRHVLGFLGIEDVTLISAERLVHRGAEAIDDARTQLRGLFVQRAKGAPLGAAL